MNREEMVKKINEYLELLPDQRVKLIMELLEVYPEVLQLKKEA